MKHRQSIQELVRMDLIYREKLGKERYGTSLHAYNGREAIVDAYEEALDLCCYLRQVIEELMIDPAKPQPDPTPASPPEPRPEAPHFRAARQRTEEEFEWFQRTALGPGA